jgi:tRNA threonylcarbamoyladenosine biosynthesis protein TsaE
VGRRFANDVRPGAVLALQGDLGTGKTQFTKGFVAGIGSNAEVTSPTFTILHEYADGRLPVYHFDFFRLENPARLAQIGFDEYLFGTGVCVIEWADRFPDVISNNARWIRFEMKSADQRLIYVG